MTTSLSPELQTTVRALAALPEFKPFPKFKVRQGLLCVGECMGSEIRLLQSMAGDPVVVVLEKLKAGAWFRVSIGAPMQWYGLIEEHRIRMESLEVAFFTLPGGGYAKEFEQAFAALPAFQRLHALHEIGWGMVLADKQVEVWVSSAATDFQITNTLSAVFNLVAQSPYVAR
jgi:hypothetical protein